MFKINNVLQVPDTGFGTYKINDPEIIYNAIKAGYRYFDTAAYYNNEGIVAQGIAQAINNLNLKRENFVIASKLWRTDMGYNQAKTAFNKSLENLNKYLKTEYIDVYLIHWPSHDQNLNLETWRALSELYNSGKIKALGLSNFLPHHAEPIIKYALLHFSVMPSIAQLEFHPGYTQLSAVKYFQDKNILVQAWSPMGRGRVLDDKLINSLAAKYNATPAQICLNFALQKNIMPLPKASSIQRMNENNLTCSTPHGLNLSSSTPDGLLFYLNPDEILQIETMPPLGWSGEHPDYERVKFI